MPAPPEISVVMATRDRAERLRAALAALRAQTLDPGRFEIVVVDDGSVDATPTVLTEALAAGGPALRILSNDRSAGPSGARNVGWRAAAASLVAFTDDDCVTSPTWLEAGLRACAQHPGAVVQGRIEPAPDERHLLGPFSRTLSVTEDVPTFATANVFYPRAVLEATGGFDEGAYATTPGGEDTDLAWRALAAGAGRAFVHEALVHHAVVPLGPVGKLRIAARWTGTMKTFADHPGLRREQLTYNLFWKGSHYLLVRALLALAIPRRRRALRRWLAWPYVAHLLRDRGRVEGGGPLLAPYFLLHDLVELWAVVRGALRYRTWVL